MNPENQNIPTVEAAEPVVISNAPVAPGSINPPPAPAAAFTAIPPHKISLLSQSKLLLASLVVYLVNLGCLGLCFLTQNSQLADSLAQATFWLGIAGAALLGAGMVQLTLSSINYHAGHTSIMTKLGIILSILSIVATPLVLIPGIILLLIGLTRPATSVKSPMSPVKKTLLAIGVFLGGGIGGLLISLAIYLATSTRACELSSSKCY